MKNLQTLLILVLMGFAPVVNAQLMDGALWISDNVDAPASDSLFYSDDPAPMMRTTFVAGKAIGKAELLITAAGYYETWLNGKPVGDRQIDPAWTDFSKRVYASRTDVTQLVTNCA